MKRSNIVALLVALFLVAGCIPLSPNSNALSGTWIGPEFHYVIDDDFTDIWRHPLHLTFRDDGSFTQWDSGYVYRDGQYVETVMHQHAVGTYRLQGSRLTFHDLECRAYDLAVDSLVSTPCNDLIGCVRDFPLRVDISADHVTLNLSRHPDGGSVCYSMQRL